MQALNIRLRSSNNQPSEQQNQTLGTQVGPNTAGIFVAFMTGNFFSLHLPMLP